MRRLALAAVLASTLAAGCGGDGSARVAGAPLATSRSLTPTAHLFGEFVHARLDVIVDRERFDPDRVRVGLDFLPYRIQTGVARSRRDVPRFTRLRFEATLRCLTIACVPSRVAGVLGAQEGRGERRTYRFPPARVLYDDPVTGKERRLRRVWWPPLDAISRLSPDLRDVPAYATLGPGGEFGSTLAPLSKPSYRLPPSLLAALLLAAALALLALPATLVARAVRMRSPQREAAPRLSPVERALRRVEQALDEGAPDRQREALEALAAELDGDGRAARARALAWRPEPPPVDAATALVAELRGADGTAG